MQPAKTSDAKSEKLGAADALELAKQVNKIIVAKGKKVAEFDMKNHPPKDDELLAHLLGPTGNLRAPVLRTGKTLVVGFNEEVYEQQFA
ncbi:MAG: hypothetical protein KatS3mg105_3005 [Gemmatales bacterium]|nr:MAG: hypothetical protein KatS3mg105_3005 [Gemmatales bacterium]